MWKSFMKDVQITCTFFQVKHRCNKSILSTLCTSIFKQGHCPSLYIAFFVLSRWSVNEVYHHNRQFININSHRVHTCQVYLIENPNHSNCHSGQSTPLVFLPGHRPNLLQYHLSPASRTSRSQLGITLNQKFNRSLLWNQSLLW